MVYDLMNTGCAEYGEASNVGEGICADQFSPVSPLSSLLYREIRLPELAAQCLRELDNYCQGKPFTDEYSLELLRRAIIQSDLETWTCMQRCFGRMVQESLQRHPQREVACRLENDENYVALTFERFWQATILNQRMEFSTLAAVLQYLRASLNGVILDTLRAYARPEEVSLPGPQEPGEPLMEDSAENGEVWETLHMLLANPREQRVAYFLFHCGLKPREIIRFCPQEWSDIQEIYRLQRTIMERILCNVDHLRWRLSERCRGSAAKSRIKKKSKVQRNRSG